MTKASYFDESGLHNLLSSLKAAFPAAISIDYLTACQVGGRLVFDAHEMTEIRKLSMVLKTLHQAGMAVGHFCEEADVRYYWDYSLTVKGFDATSRLLEGEKKPMLSTQILLKLFEITSSSTPR